MFFCQCRWFRFRHLRTGIIRAGITVRLLRIVRFVQMQQLRMERQYRAVRYMTAAGQTARFVRLRAVQRLGIIIIMMRCTAVICTDMATVTEPVYRQVKRHLQRHAIIKDIMPAIDA